MLRKRWGKRKSRTDIQDGSLSLSFYLISSNLSQTAFTILPHATINFITVKERYRVHASNLIYYAWSRLKMMGFFDMIFYA